MSELRMQCRHVFTDGHRCASPCLRHEPFCYYHHTGRRPIENPRARRLRGTTFTLPELEDRSAIQLALGEIVQRIASNDIDPRRAGHLLYALQIATSLLPKVDPKATAQPKSVAEITHDPELGDLAPEAAVGHDKEPSELDLLIEALKNRDPEPTSQPEPKLIPEIQAVAAPYLPHAQELTVQPGVGTLNTTQPRGLYAPHLSHRHRRPALAARIHRTAARRRRSNLQQS